MNIVFVLLAVLSIWDYPARYPRHERLRAQFVEAMRSGDTATMEETCRKGVELLPDDPTWHYNLACSLAYFPKRKKEAFDELEKAIDLGFRNADEIAADTDLKRLKGEMRYEELIEYAREMSSRALFTGPLATVDATGIFGKPIILGEQNMVWDFDNGCFDARLKLVEGIRTPWTGDLYMNRDNGHSPDGQAAKEAFFKAFPGVTEVKFDKEGHARGQDVSFPNVVFPYPTFGNCSMAITDRRMWRSIPRALVTFQADRLKTMQKLYLSNQIWIFPSNADTLPIGTNGDVFASITPYWMTTAGRSWSDLPYLRAALTVSGNLPRDVKGEIVRRGLLAPTIMTLIRKSLGVVTTEDEYTSLRAHPTALPANGVDMKRLVASAKAMSVDAIPPLVPIAVKLGPAAKEPIWPELTYRSPFAWAYVLRADDDVRMFSIVADKRSAAQFRFVQTHGLDTLAKIESIGPNAVRVTIRRSALSPTHRIDIAVFGRTDASGWGAPSYVSFSRMDPNAPYSDPALTPQAQPKPEPVLKKKAAVPAH